MVTFELTDTPLEFQTKGLASIIGYEIVAKVETQELAHACVSFLRFVADYASDSNRKIRSGETLTYGFWLVRFDAGSPGLLRTSEFVGATGEYREGVTFAVDCWEKQSTLCRRMGCEFAPVRADRFAAYTDASMSSEAIHGAHYPSPEHNSGWYFATREYDAAKDQLIVDRLYNVIDKRPELIAYLGLPVGWRFDSPEAKVFFDREILEG
jgi:hypothetical protein